MCTVSSKITVLLPTVKLSAFTYYESRQFYFILPRHPALPPHTPFHTQLKWLVASKWTSRSELARNDWRFKAWSPLVCHSATLWDYSSLTLGFFFLPWPSSSVWPAAEDVGLQPQTHPRPVSGAPTLSLWQDNRRSPPAKPQCQPQ